MSRIRRLGRSLAVAGAALLLVAASAFAHGVISQPSSSSTIIAGAENDAAENQIEINEQLDEVEDAADTDTDTDEVEVEDAADTDTDTDEVEVEDAADTDTDTDTDEVEVEDAADAEHDD